MRIARLANFYAPTSGGLRTALDAWGRGYVEAGDSVLTVVPGDQDIVQDTAAGTHVHLHSPRMPGGYRMVTRLGAVRDTVERHAPDVLEIHDRATMLSLAPWARARGIRTAFVAHERLDGVLAQVSPRLAALGGRAGRAQAARIAARVDDVVATTAYASAEFAAIGARVTRVPLGVDLDTFDPSRYSGIARRALAADGEVLLMAATRLARQKRPDLAVDAARELTARGRSVRLVIAGAGPAAARVRREARGVPVEMLGHVADRASLAALLATADVVVAPGPIETFGLAALEALASGTPVVCHPGSALPEVVGPAGVAAVPTGAGFADAIDAVLRRDPRARRLAARRRAERFTWDSAVAAMRALHRRSLEGAPR